MGREYIVSLLSAIRDVQHELYMANRVKDQDRIADCSERLATLQACLPIDELLNIVDTGKAA